LNYKEAREYITAKHGIVPGLTNIRRLCAALGDPQDNLKIVHIAGTNGKGSTGAFIEAILRDADLNVGRFSTPAVFDYLEQFRINGENMPEKNYARYIDKIKSAVTINWDSNSSPTPFEMELAAAFMYFAESQCDIVLLEVGMGGSMDATNVISKSLASVITPIAMDHMQFLGNSIEEIAAQKAGIIKENGVVITAPQEASVMRVIENAAAENHAELFISRENTYELSLKGAYQAENAALAAEVCRHLNLNITEENIKNGLKSAVWHGRFEQIHTEPKIIIDGAHNIHGAHALAESIKLYFPHRKITYIMGVFADKEYEEIARITAPLADKIHTITPDNPRGLNNKILADVVRKSNENVEAVTISTAVKRCLKEVNSVVIAFGSLSFLGTLKKKITDFDNLKRCSRILNDSEFQQILSGIETAEADRIYCKHGIAHLMEVARAGYIINLENKLDIPKDIIFAAALMHDIGRLAQYNEGVSHHEASAETAAKILPRCGYTPDEVRLILEAVKAHKQAPEAIKNLSDIIAEADKRTRLCMLCNAQDTCKWNDDEKNFELIM
jgi:dihydrofolate synthase/folylpolyglutamate synthase